MAEPIIRLTGDPFRDLSKLLQAALDCLEQQDQAVRLMEVPVSRWRLVSNCRERNVELKVLLGMAQEHQEIIREQVRQLGY